MITVSTKPSPTDQEVAQWLATNPAAAEPGSYPKLMYNVNLAPVVVRNLEQEASMGDAWRTLNVAPVPDVPPVTIDPTNDSLPATAGSGSFHVTITGPGASGTWIAEKDAMATWLTVSPTTPQSVDGNVSYSVTANTGAVRTANIYVNGKTFAITQSAGV
jgi:hypothetical protein